MDPNDKSRELAPLVPADRERKPRPTPGTPIKLGEHEWRLADYVPEPGPVWDRLYDANLLSGQYTHGDLALAALRLLVAAYELTLDEAVAIVAEFPIAEAVVAVERALLGPVEIHRTWSDWVSSALAANGLAFDGVPPGRLDDVLTQLVATGRAMAPSAFISSTQAAAQRGKLLAMMGRPS